MYVNYVSIVWHEVETYHTHSLMSKTAHVGSDTCLKGTIVSTVIFNMKTNQIKN